jgi:hypothetical protein
MQCKDFVDFYAEDGVAYDICHIDREGHVEAIGHLPSPAHKFQQIDGGEESGEGGKFSEEDEGGDCDADGKDDSVVDFLATVVVVEVALGDAFEFIDQFV